MQPYQGFSIIWHGTFYSAYRCDGVECCAKELTTLYSLIDGYTK